MQKKYVKLTLENSGDQIDLDLTAVKAELVYQVANGDQQGGRVQKDFNVLLDDVMRKYFRTGLNSIIRKRAVLTSNGIPIFSGVAQVKTGFDKVRAYDNLQKSVSINIFSDNAAWFNKAKLLDIRTVLDTYFNEIQYNIESIYNGLSESGARAQMVGYTVIRYKDFVTETKVRIDELTPVLFIDQIIQYCFKALGYSVQSDFFGLNSDSPSWLGTHLTLPIQIDNLDSDIIAKYGTYAKDGTVPKTLVMGTIPLPALEDVQCDTTTPLPYHDTKGSYNTSTYSYLIPYAGKYNTTLKMRIHLRYEDADNGTINVVAQSFPFKDATQIGGHTENFFVNTDILPIEVVGGVTYRYKDIVVLSSVDFTALPTDILSAITWKYAFYHPPTSIYHAGEITSCEVEFSASEMYLSLNQYITWSDQIAQPIYFDKLLSSVQQLFNLRLSTNVQQQQIAIEPADNWTDVYIDYTVNPAVVHTVRRQGFYRDSDVDWSNKLDVGQDVEIVNNLDINNIQQYDYKADNSDATANYLTSDKKPPIYGTQYDIGSDIFQQGIDGKTNDLFAGTLMMSTPKLNVLFSAPTSYTLAAAPPTPCIAFAQKENYFSATESKVQSKMEYRLLVFTGQRAHDFSGLLVYPDGLIKMDYLDGVNPDALEPLPAAWSLNYNCTLNHSGIAADPSLLWSDTSVNGVIHHGLLRKFYYGELARARNATYKRAAINLNDIDILNLDFRNIIYLNGKRYIVVMVDGYDTFTVKPTKVKLIEYVAQFEPERQIVPYCQNLINENN